MTHWPKVRAQLGTVSQCPPYHCAPGIQEVFYEEQKNDVGWVAEAIGHCLTTCISKDSKQESSESLRTEARIAQFSVLSDVWIGNFQM